MAIEQTGSVQRFGIANNANTGTVSSTITVPADAEKVIVGVSAYQGTTGGLETATFTKGGTDTAMTKVTGADNAASWQGAMWWMDAPDTGTNKSLKWDWISTGTSTDQNHLWGVTFWKGTADGVRDSDSDQNATVPHLTPTLTATSGDKIVAWAFAFASSEGTVDTWTNLTELSEMALAAIADGAWATADPSGNVAVGWSAGTQMNEGGVLAVVLEPAAVAPSEQRRPRPQVTGWF